MRKLFPIKDGEVFDISLMRKGLENIRKAFGEIGYINFSAVPDTTIDEAKKLINITVDIDEGAQFYVRRIEFNGKHHDSRQSDSPRTGAGRRKRLQLTPVGAELACG